MHIQLCLSLYIYLLYLLLIVQWKWHDSRGLKQCLTDTRSSVLQNIVDKAVVSRENSCMHEGEMKLWTSAKLLKTFFFITGLMQVAINSLPRKTRFVLWHFHRSYLKANKVSKSEETRKVQYEYHFWKCADAVYLKLTKSICACRNYSLPKLARFLRQCVG